MTIRFDTGLAIDLEEKALSESEDCWTFTGYAAVFGNIDLGNDIIESGAFKKSLNQHGLPLLLWQHKMDDAPVGLCIDAKEDKRGLWIKGELPKDDAFVRDRLVPQLKRRSLKGMSIGYKPVVKERRKDGVRLLKEVRLYEASFVTMPMNPEAGVESVKGIVPFQDLPIDTRNAPWNPEAALQRLRKHFGCEDGNITEEYRSAFLFVDEEKADAWDAYRLPIADIDDCGQLVANRVAIMKSVAALCGARKGDLLPEEAESGVRASLERYYQRMNLDAPFESISMAEWKALDVGERKARLQEFGLSRSLAAELASAQLNRSAGADRNPSQTQVGSTEDAAKLLSAFAKLSELAAAINTPT